MGSEPADVGQFNVEIEVPEEVTDWMVVSAAATSLSEAAAGSATLITGRVVRFDEGDDSVVEVRVGSDVLLIEFPNRRSELPVEGFISFQASEIHLYPYDL
ncbi:hypothetical protein [Amycolatopsis keratiniphila]|uniref:hypothetical protein n=1 Tax=Amycolatopsis keratiniphila TaxID=129921 RepID=UPI00117FA636|nr:hypothetical protein [Amycolatopsis keratiniphila]